MSDFFLDISAPGNEYQAYASTPTWGAGASDKPLPMDGNGKAGPGHSAAVAVAEIQITVLPADGNTLTIAGAVLTAKTSATLKNQWAIGASIAACVTNLVALLNTPGTGAAQCDAAVSTTASSLALALPYWQYARVKPGTTDTLQIATRFAGSTLNYPSSGVAITTSGWGTAPTITQFAGGADGPYAYFVASTAVFGKSAFAYGIMPAKAGGPDEPAAAGTDRIVTRTMRSAANLTLALSQVGVINIATPAGISRWFLFDDGTSWSGDDGQFQMSISNTSGNASHTFNAATATVLRLTARAKRGFRLLFSQATFSTSFWCSIASAGALITDNIHVGAADANTQFSTCSLTSSAGRHVSTGCLFSFKRAQPITQAATSGLFNSYFKFTDVDFEWDCGSDVASALQANGAAFSSSGPNLIGFDSCRFVVDSGAHNVLAGWSVTSSVIAAARVVTFFANCKGIGDSSFGATLGFSPYGYQYYWEDAAQGRGFRYENPAITVDFNPVGSFPTYQAVGPEGTPISARVHWGAGRIDPAVAVNALKISTTHAGADAIRTVDLELLAPTAEVPKKDVLFVVLAYRGTDGALKYQSSRAVPGDGGSLDAGVGTGSWDLAGVTGLGSYRIRITTAEAVKQDTRIEALVMFAASPTVNRFLYFDPKLTVA